MDATTASSFNVTHSDRDSRAGARKRILAGYIGNVVEWYDFALYGYLAGVIAPVFFPSENPTAGLIATYGIFAAGFMMRPLGAAAFGWFGDMHGRARTMQISVALMAVPTLLLGMLPTYSEIGLWAPVLLVVIRLLQGLSVGGEFSSSATYLVETAPQNKRGLTGSWANIGSMSGSLMGAGAAALTTSFFDQATLEAWAWRIPFLAGALLGALGYYMRHNLKNSQRFEQLRPDKGHSPLLHVFTTHRRQTLLAVAFAGGYGVCYYLAFVYLPEWLNLEGLMSRGTALTINSLMTLLIVPAIPLTSVVGDKFMPRRTFVALSFLLMALIVWPLHAWMLATNGSLVSVIASNLILFLLVAVPLGSAPTLFVEMFPAQVRLSGYSVGFNVGMGVFGGLTPMIASILLAWTGLAIAPALFMSAIAVLTVGVLMVIPDHSRTALR